MRMVSYISDTKGLTLVELMIVLVLSILLMGAVYMTFQLQHSSSRSQMEVSAVQNDIRVAIDIMAVDVMHAGLSRNPSTSIQGIPGGTSGVSTLRLQMDTNDDGVVTSPGEVIAYELDAEGNLVRNDVNAGVLQVIASNVTKLEFGYRGTTRDGLTQDIDPGGGTLDNTQARAVRFVNISVTMRGEREDAQTHAPIQRTLSRWVCRRNGVIDAL